MYILSEENELARLLDEMKKHPASVFTYGAQLSTAFPTDVLTLCLDEIRKHAAEANNRLMYKKICGNIKKLVEYGGNAEADDIITELKSRYPRRPAMIEELDILATRLAKKRK